jgi:pimeloyl-ACP methyl ester carboxylesterase
MKILLILFIFGGTLLLLYILLRYLLHKIFYFPPVKNSIPLESLEIPSQTYRILTHNHKTIQAVLYHPQQKGPLLIGIHGYENTADKLLPVTKFFATRGFRVLLVNTRNHGESDADGTSTMVQYIQDLGSAIAFARTNLPDASSILLLGHSLGGATCLYVAAYTPGVSAVISIASFASLGLQLSQSLRSHHFPATLVKPVLRYLEITHSIKMKDLSPLYTITKIRIPTLLLHGSRDLVVAADNLEMLRSVTPGPFVSVQLMEGENHSSLLEKPAIFQLIYDFLERNGLIK